MNLLMLSGNHLTAQGKFDAFFYMLTEFSQYWDRIDVICPAVDHVAPPSFGGKVFFHPAKPSRFHKFLQPFHILKVGSQLAKERQYDLMTIHEYAPFMHGMGGLALHSRFKIPFVSEFHHIDGYPHASDWKGLARRLLSGVYAPFVAKRALAIRVVNKVETPEFLRAHGVPEEKLLYLPSFLLNFEIFHPQPEPKTYDLIYCGRLVREKGLLLFLEAIRLAKDKLPNVKVLLVGLGPLRAELDAFVEENELQSNVTFWGWAKDSEELSRLYNRSRLFVLTSYAEGGPRTPLEAMACKVAVLSTPVGIMREVLKDGENGYLIDWQPVNIAERIVEVLSDEALQSRLAENGYHDISRMRSLKEIVRDYAVGCQEALRKSETQKWISAPAPDLS